MGWMDGSLGLVEYRAPYGANKYFKVYNMDYKDYNDSNAMLSISLLLSHSSIGTKWRFFGICKLRTMYQETE